MASITLGENNGGKTIMIFTEGTVIKHRSLFSLYDFKNYIPIGDAVGIINGWHEQGFNIVFCTSRRNNNAEIIATLLKKLGFKGSALYYRNNSESYKSLVETICPSVLIEDDCKSIGGAKEMCITYVAPQIKENILSVVTKEFEGIDKLPRDAEDFFDGKFN